MDKKQVGDAKGYDQTGKYLSDHDPIGFLRLIGAIESEENVTIEIVERELITPSRAVDRLYRVTDARGTRLTHGEIQTRWKGAVPPRVADYGARIYLLTGELVESYVLLLTNNPAPPHDPPAAEIRVGDLFISKGYRLIKLWELDASEWLASQRPYLLPFVPLMRGGEAHLADVANTLCRLPDEHQRKELSAYFAIIGGLRYDRNIISDVLKEATMLIPREDLRESSVVQGWLEEGREEGRASAVYEMVRRAANRYFPNLVIGPDLERITNLDALEDLCLTMHTLPDAESLRARLAELIPPAQPVNGSTY
ncbi:MAG: hypothetical protein ACREEM_32770 [Blastocatellia bacterium]